MDQLLKVLTSMGQRIAARCEHLRFPGYNLNPLRRQGIGQFTAGRYSNHWMKPLCRKKWQDRKQRIFSAIACSEFAKDKNTDHLEFNRPLIGASSSGGPARDSSCFVSRFASPPSGHYDRPYNATFGPAWSDAGPQLHPLPDPQEGILIFGQPFGQSPANLALAGAALKPPWWTKGTR